MLARQRQAKILAELERAGGVRVADLVTMLEVSDMTVRRDLDVLARQGLLHKVHGGATLRLAHDRSTDEPGFEAKSVRDLPEKRAIARVAAELVEPGSAVALSAGTTTWSLAARLTAVPELTVVTNSIRVAEILYPGAAAVDRTVLLIGGLRTPSDALVGPIAVDALRQLRVDLCFLGVHGMDEHGGFTTPNLMEAETSRVMAESARRLVVVADHSKWGVLGLCRIAHLAEASAVVSDSGLADPARQVLSEEVGELFLADLDPRPRGSMTAAAYARG